MIIILYLSIALIAIAFLILVISLSKTLKSMKITLNQVSQTMEGLEGQLKGITTETTILLHKTNALAEDIQQKTEKLNTVVDAVKDVGTTITQLNHSVRNVTTNVTSQIENNQERIGQVLQWSHVLKELKDQWVAKKEQKQIKKELDEMELREVKRARSL